MQHSINKIYLNAFQIDKIITDLANRIEKYYFDYIEVTCIIVLNGSKRFGEDLLAKLPVKFKPVFIKAKSYIGKESQRKVELDLSGISSLLNKNILLIDDIYDTGKTLSIILQCLEGLKPLSLKTCVLLNKINTHQKDIKIDFIGKEVHHKDFLVGYGLDYNGTGREWPYIVRVHEDSHAKEIKKIIEKKKSEKTHR